MWRPEDVDHRPWPVPDGPWAWRQSWRDLLFAHWPVPADRVRPLVPDGLEVDERDGTSWVGVVPFRMAGVARRPLPPLPGLSGFPEINVRLYVTHGGRPGVWFLSLDASHPLAVPVGRLLFHIPYHLARMTVEGDGETVVYRSARRRGDAVFRARYGPTGPVARARAGTLDHWLTERYCLYSRAPDGSLRRAEVHHAPWPLQPAEAAIEKNTMCRAAGLALPDAAPRVHFAREIDVVMWPATRP